MEKTREYSKNPTAVRAREKRWRENGGMKVFIETGGTEQTLFGDVPAGKIVQQRPVDKPRRKRRPKAVSQPELFSE